MKNNRIGRVIVLLRFTIKHQQARPCDTGKGTTDQWIRKESPETDPHEHTFGQSVSQLQKKPRASPMLVNPSATKLHPSPQLIILYKGRN